MLAAGITLAVIGAVFLFGSKVLPFLGRMPGDVSLHFRGISIFAPLVTCVLLSVVLTVVVNVIGQFFNRP